MELGTYQAVKDVAMQTGNSAWMLMDGGKIEVTQIDSERSKALFKIEFSNGKTTSDWMHFSRFSKCFVHIPSIQYVQIYSLYITEKYYQSITKR